MKPAIFIADDHPILLRGLKDFLTFKQEGEKGGVTVKIYSTRYIFDGQAKTKCNNGFSNLPGELKEVNNGENLAFIANKNGVNVISPYVYTTILLSLDQQGLKDGTQTRLGFTGGRVGQKPQGMCRGPNQAQPPLAEELYMGLDGTQTAEFTCLCAMNA